MLCTVVYESDMPLLAANNIKWQTKLLIVNYAIIPLQYVLLMIPFTKYRTKTATCNLFRITTIFIASWKHLLDMCYKRDNLSKDVLPIECEGIMKLYIVLICQVTSWQHFQSFHQSDHGIIILKMKQMFMLCIHKPHTGTFRKHQVYYIM